MKNASKALFILLALALTLSLSSCTLLGSLSQAPSETKPASEAPAAPGTENPETPAEPEPEKLDVIPAIDESFEVPIRAYDFSEGNEYYSYTFRLPKITGNTDTIKKINSQILSVLDSRVETVSFHDILTVLRANNGEMIAGDTIDNFVVRFDYKYGITDTAVGIAREYVGGFCNSGASSSADFFYYDPVNDKELRFDAYLAANGLNLSQILSEFNASKAGAQYSDPQDGMGKPLDEANVYGVLAIKDGSHSTYLLYYHVSYGNDYFSIWSPDDPA